MYKMHIRRHILHIGTDLPTPNKPPVVVVAIWPFSIRAFSKLGAMFVLRPCNVDNRISTEKCVIIPKIPPFSRTNMVQTLENALMDIRPFSIRAFSKVRMMSVLENGRILWFMTPFSIV